MKSCRAWSLCNKPIKQPKNFFSGIESNDYCDGVSRVSRKQ